MHHSSVTKPRPPSTSTLFPYTTLFRSQAFRRNAHIGELGDDRIYHPGAGQRQRTALQDLRRASLPTGKWRFSTRKKRSEEHTSELQSLRHLVCRLLLEKKKQLDPDWTR